MKNILLVGGSGYIGTVIIDDFFNMNIKIKDLDFNIYGDQKEIIRKKTKNVSYVNLDLRDTKLLTKHLEDIDSVVILAGLVGEHITNKYKSLSKTINEDGLINLIDEVENHKNINNVIFVSTCSNYGITKNEELVSEEYELKPLSPYAKAKVKIEHYLLSKNQDSYAPTILRFATAFGYSPRMRFDLTVNHFCYSMLKDKKIEVFDADTWRPYCHVKDFSRLILTVLESEKNKIHRKVFNAGSDKNNYTKEGIVNLIHKQLPDANVVFKKGGVDRRDYRVSFKKVEHELNFKAKYNVEHGIDEIIQILNQENNKFLKEDALSIRGNFNILNHVK